MGIQLQNSVCLRYFINHVVKRILPYGKRKLPSFSFFSLEHWKQLTSKRIWNLLVQQPARDRLCPRREASSQQGESRVGRGDRWGPCWRLQLCGGAGCSEEYKIRAVRVLASPTKWGFRMHDKRIWYLINNASDQEGMARNIQNLVYEGSCTLALFHNLTSF